MVLISGQHLKFDLGGNSDSAWIEDLTIGWVLLVGLFGNITLEVSYWRLHLMLVGRGGTWILTQAPVRLGFVSQSSYLQRSYSLALAIVYLVLIVLTSSRNLTPYLGLCRYFCRLLPGSKQAVGRERNSWDSGDHKIALQDTVFYSGPGQCFSKEGKNMIPRVPQPAYWVEWVYSFRTLKPYYISLISV